MTRDDMTVLVMVLVSLGAMAVTSQWPEVLERWPKVTAGVAFGVVWGGAIAAVVYGLSL